MNTLSSLTSLALVYAALCAPHVARADSPLTSADFHTAYANVREVALAKRTQRATGDILQLLLDDGAPIAHKAAVINALGWKFRGQSNAALFLEGLSSKHGSKPFRLKAAQLSAPELFCLGYLRAMDDYLKLSALAPGRGGVLGMRPANLLAAAAKKEPTSFTVALITAMVRAQKEMSRSFCRVYDLVEAELQRFPAGRRDFSPAALRVVMGYIGGYKKYCKRFKPKRDPELDQIYTITRYKGWIVTGTQGGVVFWQPGNKQPHRTDKAFIAAVLLEHDGRLWVGSHYKLFAYRGDKPKTYLKHKGARGIYPFLTREGKLMARRGRRLFRYDARRDRFVRAGTDASPYARIIRRNGEIWEIEFLRALIRRSKDGQVERIARKSGRYPGADPRQFYEADDGTLWVMDFDNGFYRYDEAQRRFVSHPVVNAQASAMAIDVQRGRRWFLHYRKGLHLLFKSGDPKFFDLRKLQYMRALFLDKQTGDVWVGGWTELLQLEHRAHVWLRRSYRVVAP